MAPGRTIHHKQQARRLCTNQGPGNVIQYIFYFNIESNLMKQWCGLLFQQLATGRKRDVETKDEIKYDLLLKKKEKMELKHYCITDRIFSLSSSESH